MLIDNLDLSAFKPNTTESETIYKYIESYDNSIVYARKKNNIVPYDKLVINNKTLFIKYSDIFDKNMYINYASNQDDIMFIHNMLTKLILSYDTNHTIYTIHKIKEKFLLDILLIRFINLIVKLPPDIIPIFISNFIM